MQWTPAAFAAAMPCGESSNATASFAATPSSSNAAMYRAGEGLLGWSGPVHLTVSKKPARLCRSRSSDTHCESLLEAMPIFRGAASRLNETLGYAVELG